MIKHIKINKNRSSEIGYANRSEIKSCTPSQKISAFLNL